MSLQYISPDDEYMSPIDDYSPDQSEELEYTPSSNRNNTSKSIATPQRSINKARNIPTESNNMPIRAQSTSKQILSNVLEQDWSISSPSKKKRMKILKQSIQKSDSKRDISPTKGNIDNITAKKFSNYHSESHPFVIKSEQLRKSLENVKNTEFYGIESLSPESKAVKCLEHLKSFSKDVKFTALHHLYNIVIGKVTDSVIEIILDELLHFLDKWEELDDEFLEYMLEIIGTIGPHPMSIEKLPLMISMIIHDETSTHVNLHQAAFSCVFHLGFSGVESLIKLANKEFPYLQAWVLEKLVVTNLVQRTIIVPALAQDALTGPGPIKAQAVSALNRMYSVVWEGGALPVLLALMEEGSVDRPLVACTIRACGQIGEQTLIKLLKQSPSGKVRMACAGAICWRVPTRPRQIEIRVVTESVKYEESLVPGTVWRYLGNIRPVVQDDINDEAILEINARDLIASLQRWVRRENRNSIGEVFPLLPTMPIINDTAIEEEQEISLQAIRALSRALKDDHPGVRETAAYSLGFIGLPEAAETINALIRALKDKMPQIRNMAAWAIGRLGTEAAKATTDLLILLKDEFWKVRSAACISLASAGPYAANIAIPVLLKVLKEGSINRATVAETIVRLGVQGEKIVIDMLNKEPLSNIILRTSIIKGLGQANVGNNNIDYVIETLYKLSVDRTPQIRKEALLSMKSIAERSKAKLTYLKPKTLLPLYIRYLKDPVKEIRDICVQCIVNTGPQGELTLIEALTKDSNHIVRAQAAKGLGLLSPGSFRTLILGLHDSHPYVRKAVASIIYKYYTVKTLMQEYMQKVTQRQTLRCAIREVLALPYPLPLGCNNLLKEFLGLLEEEANKEYTE
ncbi:hypothetical protein SteCoe_12627 [Stentor coeruleus]|uniref:TOG domain-containing protein n=1 Tax=Stentor coeruleus TaxID=5963 RepID=A0A1R2CA95_9CILI|nr:hypothetical protein SteCoe_12627 [Stentor coeruleus]